MGSQIITQRPPTKDPITSALPGMNLLINPSGASLLVCLTLMGALALFNGKTGRKPKLAAASWSGTVESRNARKKAIQQLNEKRRNAVSFYINRPDIEELDEPIQLQGKPIERFKITRDHATLWLPDMQRGTAVIGAPGSGKTFSMIDPALRSVIDQGVPLALYDFKYPTQSARLAGYARANGYDVKIFAPGFPESEVCNLLEFMRDENDAEMARQIAQVLNKNFTQGDGKGGDQFFQMSGDQLITATLQLAKSTEFPDLLMCQKILALPDLVNRLKDDELSQMNEWVRLSFDQLFSMAGSEKTISGVVSTAMIMFSNFASPSLIPCFTGKSTIPLELTGKQLLIFGMDVDRREVIAPLLATVIHMIMSKNLKPARKDPIVLSLDEFPTIKLPAIVRWLNECREYGFCGVLGFQNFTQLEQAYGKETSRAILSGCNTKFIFNPGEQESAEYFSKYIGEEEINYKSKSKSSGRGGGSTSVADQDRTRKLFAPEQFLRLPAGTAVIINPAYANKTEASIPFKRSIKVAKQDIEVMGRSGEVWDKVLAKLIKANTKKAAEAEDLAARIKVMEALFPGSQEEDEE
ncbi:hypothetical protein BST81_16820 [Leptolyngbya sp. 'hensonii']|uniref:type IV secretory system conjugative DNA transfer family protein n=1 Tax=Leptolyngbya sp. 'hensonii' TaxID=1922337 RepID=UPI00094FC9DB|nr:type IV secretion system DNA-binding domain-containing protein [Leptolyngbya sp. 'hensonii']OLP17452.1 hypothetical protein BST81_16820 [Leptolyngbya sp. 'hensonii']